MPLTPITSWSLQSPDTTPWQLSVSNFGIFSWNTIGAPITATPPVYQGFPSTVIWTPSISNAGIVSYTDGVAAGQFWASVITSTQFNLNVRNDPGASNLDFTWQAAVY